MNKRKIVNDPVYGFVSIPYDIIFDLIEHPWFQRLRRIRQLGLTDYVYPGALHTRFSHALGALHLTLQAISVLRSKGHEINEEEAKALCIAILLHDIGHGPFSHTLENTILPFGHERISLAIMKSLNEAFGGRLSLAIRIFKDEYEKPFLHQLISSQLDMDRMDYLNRDSFFTGVYEGVIGYDRIIKMLEVRDGQLVVEAKGIYSIEKFLIARRLMYWQVYLHKTVLSAEIMLRHVVQRAHQLALAGRLMPGSPALDYFLFTRHEQLAKQKAVHILDPFTQLDDNDIMAAIKIWRRHDDPVLRLLSGRLIDRRLFKLEFSNKPYDPQMIEDLRKKAMELFSIPGNEADCFVTADSTSNHAYKPESEQIGICYKDGSVKNIAQASEQLNMGVLSQAMVKYYLCYPKELSPNQ